MTFNMTQLLRKCVLWLVNRYFLLSFFRQPSTDEFLILEVSTNSVVVDSSMISTKPQKNVLENF